MRRDEVIHLEALWFLPGLFESSDYAMFPEG